MRSGFPEFMLKEERETWDIALNLVSIIEQADEGRRITGRLWQGRYWDPGCKVCALGVVYEGIVPRDTLVQIEASHPGLCLTLKPAYEDRFETSVKNWSFTSASSLITRLNDQLNLPFAEQAQVIREAFHEQYPTG